MGFLQIVFNTKNNFQVAFYLFFSYKGSKSIAFTSYFQQVKKNYIYGIKNMVKKRLKILFN
jgi:hypothetical protein